MPRFPIVRSTTQPSGRGTSVPAQLDTDIGAGQVARAMTQAGANISKIGLALSEKLTAAEDALALSNGQRKIKELRNSYLEALQTMQDPEGAKELEATFLKDVGAVSTGRHGVDNQLEIFKNAFLPATEIQARAITNKIRIKRIEAETKINETEFLKEGDKEGFIALTRKTAAVGIITPEEEKYKIEQFDTNSLLTQFGIAAGNGDLEAIKVLSEELDELNKKTPLNQDQLKYKTEMKTLAKKQYVDVKDKFIEELTQEMLALDAKDLMANELRVAHEALNDKIMASNLTGKDKLSWEKYLLRWYKGEGEINDTLITSFRERLDSMKRTGRLDSTLLAEMRQAKMNGDFGPRGKASARQYNLMVREFKREGFANNMEVANGLRAMMKARYSETPTGQRRIRIYEERLAEGIEANPTWTRKQAFLFAEGLKEDVKNMSKEQLGLAFTPRNKPKPIVGPGPVRMRFPDGTVWDIRPDKVDIAIKEGAKRI